MNEYQERIENFYDHLVEGELLPEDIGFFYKRSDPFIKNVVKKYNLDIGRARSFGYLSLLVASLMQLYALTEINYIVLKHNLEKELKKELTEDEIFTLANKMNPSIFKNFCKRLDFDLPWENKALIYRRMNQIDMILNAKVPSFLEKYKKDVLNEKGLKAISTRDWQVLCSYYQCVKNVQERYKLKQIDGIDEFSYRYFMELEDKYKRKLNSNQLILLPSFFPLSESKEQNSKTLKNK